MRGDHAQARGFTSHSFHSTLDLSQAASAPFHAIEISAALTSICHCRFLLIKARSTHKHGGRRWHSQREAARHHAAEKAHTQLQSSTRKQDPKRPERGASTGAAVSSASTRNRHPHRVRRRHECHGRSFLTTFNPQPNSSPKAYSYRK